MNKDEVGVCNAIEDMIRKMEENCKMNDIMVYGGRKLKEETVFPKDSDWVECSKEAKYLLWLRFWELGNDTLRLNELFLRIATEKKKRGILALKILKALWLFLNEQSRAVGGCEDLTGVGRLYSNTIHGVECVPMIVVNYNAFCKRVLGGCLVTLYMRNSIRRKLELIGRGNFVIDGESAHLDLLGITFFDTPMGEAFKVEFKPLFIQVAENLSERSDILQVLRKNTMPSVIMMYDYLRVELDRSKEDGYVCKRYRGDVLGSVLVIPKGYHRAYREKVYNLCISEMKRIRLLLEYREDGLMCEFRLNKNYFNEKFD